MSTRAFNKEVYDQVDMACKNRLKEVIELNSDYRVCDGLNNELYKKGDLAFKNGNKIFLFENEVREQFDNITQKWNTIHIPIRKKYTPADFYVVWNKKLDQFILIDVKKTKSYWDNIVNVECNHEMSKEVKYVEPFIDIPKKETQWYVINQNNKLQKVSY